MMMMQNDKLMSKTALMMATMMLHDINMMFIMMTPIDVNYEVYDDNEDDDNDNNDSN